jgi:hypothetical protein
MNLKFINILNVIKNRNTILERKYNNEESL